ncbi:MAG: sodium:proton antiporter [Verrucomicrobiae bacterium]|nr:sodium:proton antiporter [Verrucomicrobiae bacterium]
MTAPFAILLLAIAIMPLAAHEWWEHHYPKVSAILGATTLFYYLVILREISRPLGSLHEYFSFICLIGSLFVVSGGIHIGVKGESTPLTNTLLLLIGAVLANLIGTTGASMLLIRPYLRSNKYRLTEFHVVFFIFIVGNIGGALTPIGDPPLYLGYLKGVPFFWTLHSLSWMWLLGVGWLLGVFYLLDHRNFLRAPKEIREQETAHETWSFGGWNNLFCLAMILGALFIQSPLFLREALMILAAGLSWKTTAKTIHEQNQFTWAPIREVAILFAGIFMTMMPALDWLEVHASNLGVSTADAFFWGCGVLSSILDNAPTYLSFLSASIGLFVDQDIINGVHHLLKNGAAGLTAAEANHTVEINNTLAMLKRYHPESLVSGSIPLPHLQIAYLLGNHAAHLKAVSIGAVFFGACTYIGNGPNFMIKSIADHAGAKTPSFPGYIFKYTLPILLPLFIMVWWLFFR